jgi:hypothetical protein
VFGLWRGSLADAYHPAVSGYVAVWEISRVDSGDSIFAKQVADGATTLFALSFGTNVIVTSLIGMFSHWFPSSFLREAH